MKSKTMMDDDFNLVREADESFGPGSDLILSLLALSLLLLGVVGSGGGAFVAPPEELLCEGGECAAPMPVEPSVSLTKYQELLAERDEIADQRDEFRDVSRRMADYLNRLRDAQQGRENMIQTPEPPPPSVTVGTYPLPLKDLIDALNAELQIGLSNVRIDRFERDFARARRSAQHPVIVEIMSEVPAELTAEFPRDLSSDQLLTEVLKTSTALAASFQTELLKSGIPLNCIELRPVGYANAIELERAVTSRNDNLADIKRLQSYYLTRSRDELLNALATAKVTLVPNDEVGCEL